MEFSQAYSKPHVLLFEYFNYPSDSECPMTLSEHGPRLRGALAFARDHPQIASGFRYFPPKFKSRTVQNPRSNDLAPWKY